MSLWKIYKLMIVQGHQTGWEKSTTTRSVGKTWIYLKMKRKKRIEERKEMPRVARA